MKVEDEKFPVGMRVLVVDDDPTCLRLMEALLHKCQYHVTTTSQGKEALKMLKKNKNMFDIVITDVCMPGIDGFKLLQIMALEMDLPVIMLSAYGETKLVMTGIKYGACDYLLKPVRIQELQNIWQHVVRRNKSIMLRRPASSPNDGSKRAIASTSRDAIRDGKPDETSAEDQENGGDYNKVHDGHDTDENANDDESEQEQATQKKPRLFWSHELHQKFIDAVTHLGLDKAFPKKILDLMNVEGLTREQVASHLQKYRIYLRKMNSSSSQPANRIGSLGSEDMHLRSLGGGYGVFRTLGGSANFLGATSFSCLSHPQGGMLGRFNANSGLSMRAIASSPMFQRPQHLNTTSTLTTLGQINPTDLHTNANSHFFQGVPTPSITNAMFNGNPLHITTNVGNPSSSNNFNSSNIGVVQSPAVVQSSAATPIDTDALDYFCGLSSLEDSGGSADQSHGGLNGANSFTNLGNWQDQRPDFILNSSNLPSVQTSLTTVVGPSDRTLNQNNNISSLPFTQLEGTVAPHFTQQNETLRSNVNSVTKFDENYLLDDPKLFGDSSQNSTEYLGDIVGRFLKQVCRLAELFLLSK
ncbi:hypothetical protein Cgig2_015053 [Carnegiea gigantea]|uniref:Two-component response regulator n=1 Tax=Carnegiea gigantea TaxID=171969 RepID=A0A9Q1QCQ8_9CARY|nr:hypothetical protein Cgig2_015053 [Carnegiea gigantea]